MKILTNAAYMSRQLSFYVHDDLATRVSESAWLHFGLWLLHFVSASYYYFSVKLLDISISFRVHHNDSLR
jgi:hypothetical protein